MREQIDLTDRTAIVTGAASGIGREVATEFASEGANVIVADIDEDRGQSVANKISENSSSKAVFSYTDVSDYDSCQDTVETTLSTYGTVDILANIAAGALGNSEDMTQPFVDETPQNWEPHIQVSLRGPLNMTHNVLPHMREQGSGAIVNFASESYKGQDPNLAVYATAKAGIVAFSKTLAKEVGSDGIRVNCISPSTTRTPTTEDWLDEYGDKIAESYPLGRVGRPQDHANATVFLASDAADWITGQVLSVNGGFL